MQTLTVRGYDHVKVVVKDRKHFETCLQVFGFGEIQIDSARLEKPQSIWGSGDAFFCVYEPGHPFAKRHYDLHGDTVFDLAFLVAPGADIPLFVPGVGEMKHSLFTTKTFQTAASPRGILGFDHNTLNIEQGALDTSVNHYLQTFGFEKGQYFNIKGKETGLYSRVTRAPDKSVQIPFNEAADKKSQIQEFIDIHRGPGVQHLALRTRSIIDTMDGVMKDNRRPFSFLDIPDTYYELVSKRMTIRERFEDLARLRILVDQDPQAKGTDNYLLQIFTNTLFGGFFFELIQREGNEGFGEGNFSALFESMELDQKRRGVI